jgi:DNA-binding CsgD family transcriptional regulator
MSRCVEPLSARELEVLRLAAAGYKQHDLGRRLGIAQNTVKNHMTAICAKLGACSTLTAVVAAAASGQLDLGRLEVAPAAPAWRRQWAWARYERWYWRARQGAPAWALREADGVSASTVFHGIRHYAEAHGLPYPYKPHGPKRRAWEEPA